MKITAARARAVASIPIVFLCCAGAASAKPAPAAPKAAPVDVSSAVLRVEVSIARRDWTAPWKIKAPEQASASAFAIAPDRLLTNAHVVRDAQQITVKRNDGSAPALATVEAVDEDCDLAVLHLPDKSLLAGVTPLKLGELPALGSSVTTYGYPVGGREQSTTTGVVSRFESVTYAEGLARHLAGQTDAAINPGNSGGPVVQDGRVVGVAFQRIGSADNIAFFIPTPIVRHFLDDLADGHYAGFPDVPATFSTLESPAARRERGLPPERSGVIVEGVETASGLQGVLVPGDVLTAVDGERISDDGTYAFGKTRLPFHNLLDTKSVAQAAHLEVWRSGKALTVEWVASRYAPWEHLRRSPGAPRYLVYGGLLFEPVTIEYLAAARPAAERRVAIFRAVETQLWGPTSDPDREVVVLARVMRDPVNEGVYDGAPAILERVNGQPVRNLADLARLLDGSHARRDVFEFGSPHERLEALEHDKVNAARPAFLAAHGISHDRNL